MCVCVFVCARKFPFFLSFSPLFPLVVVDDLDVTNEISSSWARTNHHRVVCVGRRARPEPSSCVYVCVCVIARVRIPVRRLLCSLHLSLRSLSFQSDSSCQNGTRARDLSSPSYHRFDCALFPLNFYPPFARGVTRVPCFEGEKRAIETRRPRFV